VVVTGSFEGAVDFGGGELVSAGAADVFVATYSADGRFVWARAFGGPGSDRGLSAAFDAVGDVLLAGSFEGTVDFGAGPLTSAGATDIFLVRISGP
jgi:hypothetical protein